MLFSVEAVKALKDIVRPLKHAAFGLNDIYRWVGLIRAARPERIQVVFDVGASIGEKTLLFLRSFPAATVYCVEPRPEALQRLMHRTRRFADRIVPLQLALHREERLIDLHLASYGDASSLLGLEGLENDRIRLVGRLPVTARRLDRLAEEHGVTRIDVLKVDVEGMELEVLEGAGNLLASAILNLIVEISPLRKGPGSADHIRLFELLHGAGFAYIGCDVDYFFSKDPLVLSRFGFPRAV